MANPLTMLLLLPTAKLIFETQIFNYDYKTQPNQTMLEDFM